MTASVTSLGYIQFTATDLDVWEDFGQRVLGLMADRMAEDRIRFRADEKVYRLEVRAGAAGGVSAVGWEPATGSPVRARRSRRSAGSAT
jgi:hypothetical protein